MIKKEYHWVSLGRETNLRIEDSKAWLCFCGGVKGANTRDKGRSMARCQTGKKFGGEVSEIVSVMGFLWSANRREAVLLLLLSVGKK